VRRGQPAQPRLGSGISFEQCKHAVET
jgi:hypothetical protein